MRRIAFIVALAAALGLTVPGAALAKTHRGAHARHHARTRPHHKTLRARTLMLTPASVNSSSSSTGTSGSADSSSTGTSTSSSTPESIGTVASFTNGMLTLNLNNGSTASGLVDPSTEFECVPSPSTSPTQTAAPREDGAGSGSGDSSGSSSGSGDQSSTQPTTTPQSGEDAPDSQDNETADTDSPDASSSDQPAAGCDQSLLVNGAAVKEAELRITPTGGSTFEKIVLFH